jgi:hypothetical protein
MFKRAQQFILILFMFQFVLGSTAWMYSSHFCKMQDGCADSMEASCCIDDGDAEVLEIPTSDDSCCPSDFAQTENCCFEISPYINFPVYRIVKTELPSDHVMVASLFERSLDLIAENSFVEGSGMSFNFPKIESPPLDKLILYSVFRI